MRTSLCVLMALSLSLTVLEAPGSLITDAGSADTAGAIANNLSTTDVGNRELSWRSSTIHSQIGQSFVATSSGTAMGISLFVTSPETYSSYESPVSFKLKVFDGNTSAANEIGSYTYDVHTLTDAIDDTWLRFGLDSGVAMTSGSTYSFIMTFNSEVAAHRINFQRTKGTNIDGDQYLSGAELRPASSANLYDAANFDTDPWDTDSANPVGELGTGDLRFTVDTIPEPSALAMLALGLGALLARRKLRA